MAFNCYIDETGDEGIETGGSRWFILGALIVSDAIDFQTSAMVNRIKTEFKHDNKWVLHWSKIKKHNQKRYICQELLTEEWNFACIATDKTHPFVTSAKGLKQKYALYFYSTRLLLERLSWYARDKGNQKAIPIFEYRSSVSYDEMRKYFKLLRNWEPPTEVKISWDNLEYEDFRIIPKKQSRLLQAADCLCGTVKDGLEYSGYGFIEPAYALSVIARFYRRGGNLFSYGFKFLHANRKGSTLKDLKGEYEWLEKI
jgi:hypothetical protein